MANKLFSQRTNFVKDSYELEVSNKLVDGGMPLLLSKFSDI